MKKMIQNFTWKWIIPPFLVLFFYPYILTLRVKQFHLNFDLTLSPFRIDKKKKYIYGHWHEDIPILCLVYCFRRFASLASRSRDGELITRVLAWLGIKIVRGSSRHFGQETFQEILDILDENRDFALAVDGPKGPRHEVKEGIFYVAIKAKKEIIPVSANAKYKLVFKRSWDNIWFPLPFSKTVLMFGEPIQFSDQESLESLERKRQDFQSQLYFLKKQALSYFS